MTKTEWELARPDPVNSSKAYCKWLDEGLDQKFIHIEVSRALGEKCQRCWRYTLDVDHDYYFRDICNRCAEVLHDAFSLKSWYKPQWGWSRKEWLKTFVPFQLTMLYYRYRALQYDINKKSRRTPTPRTWTSSIEFHAAKSGSLQDHLLVVELHHWMLFGWGVELFCWQWDDFYFKYIYKYTQRGIGDSDLPWDPIVRWFYGTF